MNHEEMVAKITEELEYATKAGGWDNWDDATVEFLLKRIATLTKDRDTALRGAFDSAEAALDAKARAEQAERERDRLRSMMNSRAVYTLQLEAALRAHHQPNADFTLTLLSPHDSVTEAVCSACGLRALSTGRPTDD